MLACFDTAENEPRTIWIRDLKFAVHRSRTTRRLSTLRTKSSDALFSKARPRVINGELLPLLHWLARPNRNLNGTEALVDYMSNPDGWTLRRPHILSEARASETQETELLRLTVAFVKLSRCGRNSTRTLTNYARADQRPIVCGPRHLSFRRECAYEPLRCSPAYMYVRKCAALVLTLLVFGI